MKKWFYSLVALALTATFLLSVGLDRANAQTPTEITPNPTVPIPNTEWTPLPNNTSLGTVLAKILTWLFGLLGAIAVIFFIYGGVTYLTAGGNEEQAKKGKTILIQAIVGILIVLVAFAITTWVQTALQGQAPTT